MGQGGAYDLLSLMPSTTKALAQVLAGNARASGQLVHARNILAQAERMVDDRQIDRLIPADREDFLEQFARLKLTLADADLLDGVEEAEEAAAAEAKPRAAVPPERLRELALSLAGELAADAQRKADAAQEPRIEPTYPHQEHGLPPKPLVTEESEDNADDTPRAGAAHKQPRLRLKRKADLADAER